MVLLHWSRCLLFSLWATPKNLLMLFKLPETKDFTGKNSYFLCNCKSSQQTEFQGNTTEIPIFIGLWSFFDGRKEVLCGFGGLLIATYRLQVHCFLVIATRARPRIPQMQSFKEEPCRREFVSSSVLRNSSCVSSRSGVDQRGFPNKTNRYPIASFHGAVSL